MIALDDFQQLKRRIDELQQRRDHAAGAYAQLKKQLKEEFDCGSAKEGVKLLERLKQEEFDALKTYNELKKKFEEEWKHLLKDG